MALMPHADIRTPIPHNGGDWLIKFGAAWKAQLHALKAKFGAAIEQTWMPPEDPTDVPVVFVKSEMIAEVLTFLRDDPEFAYNFLSDITATDEEPRQPRFEVVYQLFSHAKLCRIRVKSVIGENQEIPTAVGVWPGADWAEREVFDMFGIRFKGHPDLRRILMDERWVGHPLRKDYPLRGYQIFPEPEKIRPHLLDMLAPEGGG